jgi:hypothetical protein
MKIQVLRSIVSAIRSIIDSLPRAVFRLSPCPLQPTTTPTPKSITLAHREKLSDGTAVYANRMIREEASTKDELLEIKAIMKGDEPTAELSRQILGDKNTLRWLEGILNPG